MTNDDAHTSHSHGFELPNAPQGVVRNDSRPWRAVAGVAVCLGLAGIVTGLIVARRQSASDEHVTSDALQREDLRDGWKALGAAAALDAQNSATPASTAAVASAAPPSVVIVNVPAQGAPNTPNAPSNVTTINVPSAPAMRSNAEPMEGSSLNPGYVPNQSLPAINYSPVQGYVPTQPDYPATTATGAPQTGYLPQNSSVGTPPLTPAVGNGSIPGSTPNPALPNNGLVGSAPVPGLPNAR